MKRIISIVLTAAILMASMCLPAVVTAETTKKKVFSLDISDYAKSGTIKNGVTKSAEGITTIKYTANTSSTGPVIGKDLTASGAIIEYLEFADDAEYETVNDRTNFRNSHNYGAVRLDDSLMQTLLAGTDDITIEFWVRPFANYKSSTSSVLYGAASAPLYTYGIATDGAVCASQFSVYDGNNTSSGYNNTYMIDVCGKYALYNSAGTKVANADSQFSRTTLYQKHVDNSWVHYVITKEWRYDENSTTTGDYYGAVYYNGADKTGSAKDSTKYENVVKNDESTYPFIIGGSEDGTGAAASGVFDGAIAEFNIYNYAMTSTEAAALYTNSQATYSGAFKAENGLKLVSPLESANPMSIATGGSIDVEFDNYVDTDTLKFITIEDSQGNKATDITPTYTGNAVKKISLTYSGLDKSTEYFLNIPATVKNKLGDALENPQKVKLKTTDGSIVSLDLSGDTPDSRFLYAGKDGDFAVTTYNGVKCIKMSHTTKSTNYFGYAFGKTEERDLIVYVTMAVQGTANQRAVRQSYNENVLNLASSSSLGSYADANGFATFKLEMLYDKTDDKYDVYMYDKDGNNIAKLLNSAKANDRAGIFIQQYNDQSSTVATYISDYRVYVYERPEVASHNLKDMMPDAETINLAFSVKLNPDTVLDCAALANKAGTKNVPIKIGTYNEATKTLSIELLEYLDGNTEYTLSLKNVKSEDGAAIKDGYAIDFTTSSYVTVGDVTFKKQGDAPADKLEGATSLSATVRVTNNMGRQQKYTAYMIHYDSTGKIKYIAPIDAASEKAVADGAYVDLTAKFNTIAPVAGDYVKCFIWGDNTTGDSKPYATQIEPVLLQY